MTAALLVGAGLRLWQVGALPPGLHYDEAADTILAREIAAGQSAPLFISAYTGKEVLFFYWAAAWMKLAGPTPYAMRLAAAMLGVLTVAASFRAVRELFHFRGSRAAAGIALLAAAFLATSFWHVLLSRLGFRSIAEPCLQALAVAALWRGLRLGHRGWLIAAGAFVGLNLYTYLAARLFPLAVGLLFGYLIAFDAGRRRQRLTQFAVVALAALVVFAPLGLYFAQNPDAFLTRIAQVAPREGQDVLANVARALGMLFLEGDPYMRFNLPGRPLFPLMLGALFAIGVVVAVVGVFRGRTRLRRAAYFFALTATLIMLLPTALAVNEITPSNLRAIGLLPMVFVFPALGTWVILRQVWRLARKSEGERPAWVARPSSVLTAVIVLVLMLGFVETGLTYAYYVRLPDLYYQSDGDLVDIAGRVNEMDAAELPIYIHALHYRHPTLAALAREFHELRSITGPDVLVFPPGPSLQVFAHLALPDEEWIGRWLPSSARLESVPGPDGAASYAEVQLDAPPRIEPAMPMRETFGGAIELLGATLNSTPKSGGTVDVTLFWRVLDRPDRGDYALFAELRDTSGHQFEWGRADSFDYPAEQWTPDEMIVQRLRVPIAPGAPPGDYQLRVGWYSAGADQRLPVRERSATTAAISPIRIERASQPPDEDALGMGTRLDARAADGLTLLGASIQTPGVPQGAPLFFTLFWRVDGAARDDPIAIRLRDPANGSAFPMTRVAGPFSGGYPFSLWNKGEVYADRYGVRVPPETPPGEHALEARAGLGQWIEVGRVNVEPAERRFDVPPVAHPVAAAFGDQVELLGYDLDRDAMRPGESITLTLVWRALRTPDDDYTVFTHLLDPSGVQRGGKDNPPVNGTYPTSRWVAGEVIVDTYRIPLDSDAPPGDYALEVGLYQFDTGGRLPLPAGGDALRLATIPVGP